MREGDVEVRDKLSDLFLSLDGEFRITHVSCARGEVLGMRVDELPGQRLCSLLPEHGDEGVRRWATFRQVMETRVAQEFVEHAARDDSFVEVRVFPSSSRGISIFFLDVSEAKRRERELMLKLERAEDTEASLSELVEAVGADLTQHKSAEAQERKRAEYEQQLIGIVSHDLRNPLQAIRLHAALGLRAAAADPQITRRLERIVAASDRAARMIDDLLDFTRARETGGIAIDPKPVDLHDLTSQVVEELLVTRPEREVTRQVEGDAQGTFDGDRLAQVVQNLVGNALQHTTEDTLVQVSTRGEADHVVLEVHNGGEPIPPADLPRLFEPFKRAKSPAAVRGRSLGLGLYITSLVVEAHGGTVRVHSTREEGTTFTVRLPRIRVLRSEEGQEP